ncbi:MAG: hypothetical protein V7749_11245 [Cocleimonas sp.]
MIESYPITAIADNWLHEAVVDIIITIHERLDNGNRVVTTQNKLLHWRGLIPGFLPADKSQKLISLRSVRDKVLEYARELQRLRLTAQERATIMETLTHQNDVPGLTSGNTPISSIENTFPTLNEKVKELFLLCYEKLGNVGSREAQYKLVYDSLTQKFCGFCGFGTMMNHEEASQDQDHYLAKSRYPFAAANIRNLVPMCIQCNRIHKNATDIIQDENLNRKHAFDPYTCNPTDLSLIQSYIAGNAVRVLPTWQTDFVPPSPSAENWDRVFNLRTRIKRDVLDECYNRWFTNFVVKCSRNRRQGMYQNPMSDQDIREVLFEHYNSLIDDLGSGKDRFKPHVFDLMLHLYDSGDDRVIAHIRDAVVGV